MAEATKPLIKTKPRKKEKPKEPFSEMIRRNIAEWTGTILLLLFATTLVVQPFVVPTGSMDATLMIGDHLFVDKLAYSPHGSIMRHLLPYQDVRRGDVIVFRYPPDIRSNYVKRVVGLPGDRIKVVNKKLWINGHAAEEPYTQFVRPSVNDYYDNFPGDATAFLEEGAKEPLRNNVVNGEIVVPPGHYFAMGDNRDNSADSRYWGFVPRANITGKPIFIFWSFDASTERLASGNIDPAHIFDIIINFFPKTRWKRTFQLIRPYPLK